DAPGAGGVPGVRHPVDRVEGRDALAADRTLTRRVSGGGVVLPAHVATGVDDVVGHLDGPGRVPAGVRRPRGGGAGRGGVLEPCDHVAAGGAGVARGTAPGTGGGDHEVGAVR